MKFCAHFHTKITNKTLAEAFNFPLRVGHGTEHGNSKALMTQRVKRTFKKRALVQ